MGIKEDFNQWWVENGKRGISACEFMYQEQNKPCGDIPNKDFRNYIREFKGNKLKQNKLIKVVQLTDLHIPYQDNKSLKALYKFLEDFKPDEIVLTGDIFDFYELSTFDKNPERKNFIQDEIDIGYKVLKKLKSLCKTTHFIKGNHEDRLRRFLWKNPSLASINALKLSCLLNLDNLDIEYHEYEYILNGFKFYHGDIVRQHSSYSAKAVHEKYGSNISFGHTHRLGSYLKTDARGTTGSYEMGCLCKLDPEYINGIPNWQQGFGVFYFEDDRFFCQQVPIIKNEFIYDGVRYK